ncbi:MAG: 2,4-dihydroxyhept-2-ene-1,7-dioic acid aldolase [Chloroflexi bacterium]|nr:2,4-dihydroxyhept-2-ene-1,7-dioic acid aldolase [Chloroflexota bacterium]
MTPSFRQRLKACERLIGTMITLASAETAEVLASVGFDWFFLDNEHSPLEALELQSIIRATGSTPCVVRVSHSAEVPIKKALDIGAAGIIAPQVNSAERAAQVVSWARYAPSGTRGVGIGRAHGYGLNFQDYVSRANDEVAVIVQAEHIDAVKNIEAIVRVPGVDAVLIGPYDLSASLGRLGEVTHPEVVAAIDRVTAACRAVNLPLGIFGLSAQAVQPYIEYGYTLIVVGADTVLLGNAARQLLAQVKAS